MLLTSISQETLWWSSAVSTLISGVSLKECEVKKKVLIGQRIYRL